MQNEPIFPSIAVLVPEPVELACDDPTGDENAEPRIPSSSHWGHDLPMRESVERRLL